MIGGVDARGMFLGVALGTLLLASRARAFDSDCIAVLAATEKLIVVPHRSFSYVTGKLIGSEVTVASEMISIDGTTYVRRTDGKWDKGASVQDLQSMYREKLKRAQHFDCGYARDEVVDGDLAAVYWTHDDADRASDDSELWISKRSGLILRSESDVNEGASDSVHVSIRHEYDNVQSPPLSRQ